MRSIDANILGGLLLVLLLGGGCGGGASSVDLSGVAEQEMVVLGRVLVYYQGDLVSGRTSLYAAGPTEDRMNAESHQVGNDGIVVWKMKRPYGELRLRWVRVTSENESSSLELGENAPVLQPAGVHHEVYYFGTMVLVLGEEIPEEVSGYELVERSRVIHIALEDRSDETLPLLAKSNSSVRGRQYYHVLKEAMATVPMGE